MQSVLHQNIATDSKEGTAWKSCIEIPSFLILSVSHKKFYNSISCDLALHPRANLVRSTLSEGEKDIITMFLRLLVSHNIYIPEVV